jgi:hypothetical protein
LNILEPVKHDDIVNMRAMKYLVDDRARMDKKKAEQKAESEARRKKTH